MARRAPRSVVLALVLACACAAPASARPLSSASHSDDLRRQARSMAKEIARPWRSGRQYSDGRFKDEVGGRSAYGEAVLGYALIDVGLREHDSKLVGVGLKAMHYATDRYSSANGAVSVFQNMAVGFTYQLAQRRLGHDARWLRIRPTVESYIRRQPLARLTANPDHFANHLLVESLAVFNYVRSGLRSSDYRAIVGPYWRDHYDWAQRWIRTGVPHVLANDVRRSNGDNTLLLSDPPDKPLAYQGLSIGLYAKAMEMLGPAAGGSADVALRRALEASWRLTAPDGDMSYFGRNQEEAWTLPATAYGARIAETAPGTSPARAARYEGLALRALARLRDVHLGGPGGIYPVPATRIDEKGSIDAIDHGGYAPYGGLALMFLNLIADTASPRHSPSSALFADGDGAAILGQGPSLFATERIGPLWMAVRAGPSTDRPTDIRYDGGLMRAKLQTPDGGWFDLIPTRPRVLTGAEDSAGPLIIRRGDGIAVFDGDHIRRRGKDGLGMVGPYRALHGSPGISRYADERFRPIDCGVQVAFPVEDGDAVEYSVFLRDTGHVERSGGAVSSDGTTVSAHPKPRIVLKGGYTSATDPRVVRVRLRWHAHKAQRMRVRICATQ